MDQVSPCCSIWLLDAATVLRLGLMRWERLPLQWLVLKVDDSFALLNALRFGFVTSDWQRVIPQYLRAAKVAPHSSLQKINRTHTLTHRRVSGSQPDMSRLQLEGFTLDSRPQAVFPSPCTGSVEMRTQSQQAFNRHASRIAHRIILQHEHDNHGSMRLTAARRPANGLHRHDDSESHHFTRPEQHPTSLQSLQGTTCGGSLSSRTRPGQSRAKQSTRRRAASRHRADQAHIEMRMCNAQGTQHSA